MLEEYYCLHSISRYADDGDGKILHTPFVKNLLLKISPNVTHLEDPAEARNRVRF